MKNNFYRTDIYGKGRVFYTGFGHPKELWQEEWFQKHLLEGIRWAAGIVD